MIVMSEDPIKRFTLLVLFQAQQDHATELVIDPFVAGGASIKYKVEGAWHAFSPPPSHILPGVAAELGRLAKLAEGAFPKEGTIDVAFSGTRLQWNIHVPSANGPCTLIPVRS
jgi:hypothetical protein